MPLRWQEVALPLVLILTLIIFKHIPWTQDLPLSRTAGVVAFGYAAFLALRLVQHEEPIEIDGWSVLRPAMVEYFAVYGAAALAGALMLAIIINGAKAVDPTEVIAAFVAAMALALGAAGIAIMGLLVKTRWNHAQLECVDAFGRQTILAWSEVRTVSHNWRGVTIATANQKITFSQFHSGAANLLRHAQNRAQRNGEIASKAFVL